MTFEYRRENDQYSFYVDGKLQFSATELAIAYDEGQRSTLLKHGPADLVQAWASSTRAAVGAVGAADLIRVSVITSTQWDVDELNRVINNSGYLDIFLQQFRLSA